MTVAFLSIEPRSSPYFCKQSDIESPIIEPAIEAEDNKEAIAKKLGEAAKDALDGQEGDAKTALKQAGQIGQDAARGWFEDPRNGWAQNSELTALRKLKKLKGKARAEAMARIEARFQPCCLDNKRQHNWIR